MKLNLVYKLGISAVLLVLISAGSVGWIFYDKTTELLVEQSTESIASEIQKIGHRLQTHINNQREETLYLAGTPAVQGMLRALVSDDGYDRLGRSSYEKWEEQLTAIFINMLANKHDYHMIRFLDVSGEELIVVKREDEDIISLDEYQLQNKSHRPYFINTLKIPTGTVYLSEINLNREHGEIGHPHLEVLRSSTPIYDQHHNRLAGMLIITANAGHELRGLQNVIQKQSSNVYITNDHGGYLLHPDKNKTYGFDLGKRYRIQEDFPRLSSLFLPDNKDSKLILLPEDTGGNQVVNFTKIAFDQDRPERFIAVGVTESYDEIFDKESVVLNEVLALSIVLASIVILFAIFFSYRLTRPIKQITQVMDDYTHQRGTHAVMPTHKHDEIGVLARSYEILIGQVEEAQQNLKEMNRNLEDRVAERTQALESSELTQRSIIENMIDGLVSIDAKGVITSFNPAAVKIFGYQRDEVIGKNVKILMPAAYQHNHDEHIDRYNKTGNKKIVNSGQREVIGQHKDGHTFPLDLAVGEIIIDGRKVFPAIVRDITERKQMDKMKNEFVSTVSHELRTPLTAIRGSLGLINGGAVGEISPKVSELLKLAGNNTDRLLLLINDILDMQKIESGEMDFNYRDMDLMSFLEKTLEENRPYGEQFGVEYVLKSELTNVILYADQNRMKQVMANLLSNASKFSPRGGEVEINISQPSEDFVRISVRDFGEGIPEEFQPKLFEKFTQSDSSTTRQKGGTGLGLSISREIVEHNGGRIHFVSKEGQGSTFMIDLPRKKTDENNQAFNVRVG